MNPVITSGVITLTRGESKGQLVLGRQSQQYLIPMLYPNLDVSEIQVFRFHLKS
jgi:hypothetical protein